jgi:ATP-dependent Clp protease ATP-binding subunit ClpC
MYERLTDRARKVMQLANQEAQRFNHEYIGTEHILLGLVKEPSGVAHWALAEFGLKLDDVRQSVTDVLKVGPDTGVTRGKLPQTPEARKVIEYAMEESRNLSHNYVGTEHILLGLLRESGGLAHHVLAKHGVKLEDCREKVLNLLGHGVNEHSASEEVTIRMAVDRVVRQIDAEIESLNKQVAEHTETKRRLLALVSDTKGFWEVVVSLKNQPNQWLGG